MNAVVSMIMTKYQYELNIDIYLRICLLFFHTRVECAFNDACCGGACCGGACCHVCDDLLAAAAAAAVAFAVAAVEPAVAFAEETE